MNCASLSRPAVDGRIGASSLHGSTAAIASGSVVVRALRFVSGLLAVLLLSLTMNIAFAQGAQPGDDFLKLVDARRYGESYDAASDFLKQSVSRADWTTQLVKARETIGEVASRKQVSATPQKDPPGAPPGDYLLVTYETVFASQGAPKVETLPLVKGADGQWRAVGYFIR